MENEKLKMQDLSKLIDQVKKLKKKAEMFGISMRISMHHVDKDTVLESGFVVKLRKASASNHIYAYTEVEEANLDLFIDIKVEE